MVRLLRYKTMVGLIYLLWLACAGPTSVQAQENSPGSGRIRLAEADWERLRPDADAKGGEIKWNKRVDGQSVPSFSIAEGTPAQVVLASRKELCGDFDVRIEVFLPVLGGQPGAVIRASLGIARAEEKLGRQAYVAIREARQGDAPFSARHGYVGAFVNEGQSEMTPSKIAPGSQVTRLRLERRNGQVVASYLMVPPAGSALPNPGGASLPQPRWVEITRFEKTCTEPVKLLLTLSNTVGKESTTFPGQTAVFSDLRITCGDNSRP
jgi:hypothetical protein